MDIAFQASKEKRWLHFLISVENIYLVYTV